jgi:hypothetical protein
MRICHADWPAAAPARPIASVPLGLMKKTVNPHAQPADQQRGKPLDHAEIEALLPEGHRTNSSMPAGGQPGGVSVRGE